MTGKQIQRLRHSLGENTEQFGKRFNVSRRTVEDWEQERTRPNKWIQPMIAELHKSQQTNERK